MAHPESDGAAEMLEGGHRSLSTAALRLAELYAQRMQIQARLREQQARVTGGEDRAHAAIAATAGQMLQNPAGGGFPSMPSSGKAEKAHADAIRDVPLDEFSRVHAQAAQELAGTGTGVVAVDEEAVLRRQFEILESEAFIRAVLGDQEQWEARTIAATGPELTARRSEELAAAEEWLARTAPADLADYRATQVGNDSEAAEQAQENLVNRYEAAPTDRRAATTPAEPAYDSPAARSARADTMERAGLDRETTESAMLTDLGFGTPAADSVIPAASARRTANAARTRGAVREHQTLGR